MREISAALSTSSSSSQQKADTRRSNDTKQAGQSTLLNEISTLRSKLRELNDDSPMNRPRSHSALLDGGRREPPQLGGESILVNQLRKELTKMEEEKAEMELTLMNQMSNLASENQTTIDSLNSRLAQSEKLVEALQQQQQSSSPKPSSSNHLEVHRLRKNLGEERDKRRALEDEREAQSKRIKDEREACEHEKVSLRQKLQEMQKQINALVTRNSEILTERDAAFKKLESLQAQLDTAARAREKEIAVQESQHKATLASAERSHQGQMQEMKLSYQQRCNQLEKEMTQMFDGKQAGVGSLHTKIAELESENENLVHSVAELQATLDEEQAMNEELEKSLHEQAENSEKIWASLEESQVRCTMLEQELTEKFESSHDQTGLKKENEALSSQVVAIELQFVAEQEKSTKLISSLEAERMTNSKLRLSLRQHQQRYEELNRNLHKSESGIGLVNGQVISLEKDRKNLTIQVSQLQEQLSKEQCKARNLEETLAEHKRAIDENLQSTAGRRQSDVAALENAQLELQAVLNSYQSDMARLERKVQLSEQQLSERNRQNQRLEVEINEERKIRKSLTAQLNQAKMANQQNDRDSSRADKSTTQSQEAEIQRLRKENAKLNDELRVLARTAHQVDPAEVELLRTQNRMLGERSNGLHSEQVKELETLREKTKALNEELDDLRTKAAASPSIRSNSPLFIQNGLKAELERLKKENGALSNDLASVKQQLASSSNDQAPKQNKTKLSPPATPQRRSSHCSTQRVPSSPNTRKELPPSGMQTPPMSPPLVGKKLSHAGSPRTPVRGIVESFERRISRSHSFTSAGVEPTQGLLRPETPRSQVHYLNSQPSPSNQAQGSQSSEVDDIRRELQEQRSTVQDLQSKLDAESDLVQGLRLELSLLEESDSIRKQLERTVQYREQDIVRLQSRADKLEKQALEVSDLREAMEQYRVTVTDLQNQLHTETELVAKLRFDLAKIEQTEAKRTPLERSLKDREAEVLRLRAKVVELEGIALEMGDVRQAMEQEKSTSQRLQNQLKAESELVTLLRKQLEMTEEKMEKDKAKVQQLQNNLKIQVERIAMLESELTDMEKKFEEGRATVEDLQSNLSAEVELAAAQRLAIEESEAIRVESQKALGEREQELRRLSNTLTAAESQRVVELRNEVCKLTETECKSREQLRESEAEVQRLRSRVGELETVLTSSSSATASEEAELAKLRGDLAQADAASKAFEAKLFEERSEMEKLKTMMASVQGRLALSESEAKQMREEVLANRVTTEKMVTTKREDEEIIERLQTELGAARMGLERSLDEMERMRNNGQGSTQQPDASDQQDRAEIQRLKSELMAAKQALDINVEEMEKLQRCVKDADASRMIAVRQSLCMQQEKQRELDSLKSEFAKERESKNGHNEEVHRLRSQVAALQQELGIALTQVEELKAMISNLQSAHESERQDAQNKGKRTSQIENTLKVELTKNQISKADMEMSYMNRIHDLENKMEVVQIEMDQQSRASQSQLSLLNFKLSQKEEEIRQLEKERVQICSSMNNISSSRKDEFDELNEEVMHLTSQTASQAREIQALKMKLEEHDFRGSEFHRLNERVKELENELRRVPPQRRTPDVISPTDVEIIKRENTLLRESVRDLTLERRNLQEKLDAMVSERSSSRSTQVLRERNSALKKEVERLTKRLKKMENNMTRFAI